MTKKPWINETEQVGNISNAIGQADVECANVREGVDRRWRRTRNSCLSDADHMTTAFDEDYCSEGEQRFDGLPDDTMYTLGISNNNNDDATIYDVRRMTEVSELPLSVSVNSSVSCSTAQSGQNLVSNECVPNKQNAAIECHCTSSGSYAIVTSNTACASHYMTPDIVGTSHMAAHNVLPNRATCLHRTSDRVVATSNTVELESTATSATPVTRTDSRTVSQSNILHHSTEYRTVVDSNTCQPSEYRTVIGSNHCQPSECRLIDDSALRTFQQSLTTPQEPQFNELNLTINTPSPLALQPILSPPPAYSPPHYSARREQPVWPISDCVRVERSMLPRVDRSVLPLVSEGCCSRIRCLNCLTAVTTFRWILVSLAVVGVGCILTGVSLGVLHVTDTSTGYITLSVLFAGMFANPFSYLLPTLSIFKHCYL